MVDSKNDIEAKMGRMAQDLDYKFLYRVVAFSLSGTCLVDLRCELEDPSCSREAKMACRIGTTMLTKLLTQNLMNKRKCSERIPGKRHQYDEEGNDKVELELSDSFQELVKINLFNLNVSGLSIFQANCLL